jgi:hypothetical protein
MHRQGYDLQLTQYDDRGWRATFYTTRMEHSPTRATGTGWERTPWRAAPVAAWEALLPSRLGLLDRLLLPPKLGLELPFSFKPVTDVVTMIATTRDVDFKGAVGNLEVG